MKEYPIGEETFIKSYIPQQKLIKVETNNSTIYIDNNEENINNLEEQMEYQVKKANEIKNQLFNNKKIFFSLIPTTINIDYLLSSETITDRNTALLFLISSSICLLIGLKEYVELLRDLNKQNYYLKNKEKLKKFRLLQEIFGDNVKVCLGNLDNYDLSSLKDMVYYEESNNKVRNKE